VSANPDVLAHTELDVTALRDACVSVRAHTTNTAHQHKHAMCCVAARHDDAVHNTACRVDAHDGANVDAIDLARRRCAEWRVRSPAATMHSRLLQNVKRATHDHIATSHAPLSRCR
jgi:hypothetical protein